MASRQQRELLKRAFPNKQWADKVDRMPNAQVVAVYMRLKQQNKI